MIITVYEKETFELLASIEIDGEDASVITEDSVIVEIDSENGWASYR